MVAVSTEFPGIPTNNPGVFLAGIIRVNRPPSLVLLTAVLILTVVPYPIRYETPCAERTPGECLWNRFLTIVPVQEALYD